MTSIVEKLREADANPSDAGQIAYDTDIFAKAADEIEHLRAELLLCGEERGFAMVGNTIVEKRDKATVTDIVERLREGIDWNPDDLPRAEKLMDDAADEIERLQHMKANLHGHIKRLEEINSKLEYENAKLREALTAIAEK